MAVRLISNISGAQLSAEEIDANFDDLHPALSPQETKLEASRCLFCYDAPCVQACPTSIDIPKFIRQLATDNPMGSAKTILSSNIMGGTCARACPTEVLCEQKCVLNAGDSKPIKIGALQRVAVDHLMEHAAEHPFKRAESTKKVVAIVGAGPAGLSCAHALAVQGHEVCILEAKAKPGGLNEYGLAAYKMVDDFAAREIEFILEIGGISIRNGIQLGNNISLAQLTDDFDAVFVGVGLGNPRDLNVKGHDKRNIDDALSFISNIRQADTFSSILTGDDIVVIGGGNTAIDAAIQAKRLGAKNVTVAYRRGPQQMGATKFEQDLAATNGVVFQHWATPSAFDGGSAVSTVVFERTEMTSKGLIQTGEMIEIPADQVLLAVGQTLNETALPELELERGKIQVDATYATSMPSIFAGGDCIRSGEDLTVQAVEDGKQAAAAMHAFLMET